MSFLSHHEVRGLTELLGGGDDDSAPQQSPLQARLNPATLADGSSSISSSAANDEPTKYVVRSNPAAGASATSTSSKHSGGSGSSGDIWSRDDVEAADEAAELADPREEPQYQVLYKQTLKAEDTYIGMSMKDPSSQSCEAITIKVSLPGTQFKEVDLETDAKRLLLSTPKYKLVFYWPDIVLEKRGSAKWDAKKSELLVTVPFDREDRAIVRM